MESTLFSSHKYKNNQIPNLSNDYGIINHISNLAIQKL